jgi:Domain of unknown function (DUF3883)
MSAFEGLRTIRRYRTQRPGAPIVELVAVIRQVDPGAYDYHAAAVLDGLVPAAVSHDPPALFYRECIGVTVPRQIIWRRTITLGRKKFTQKLSRDEQQCFRAAGLLDEQPTDDVVAWWDHVQAILRLAVDQEKLQRARIAERLSLEHEADRLRKLGITLAPTWMSVDDNTVGYDILSYDVGKYEPINRLVEVKSTIASPLRFFLTRNEWETAKKFGDRYIFHIWDLQNQKLYERSVGQITPHVPTDNEKGRWANAEIPIID